MSNIKSNRSGNWLRQFGDKSHLADLQHDLNRLADDFSRTFRQTTLEPWGLGISSAFTPKVDVRDNKDQVIATVEVPGIAEKDIEVTLTNDTLAIRGEKKTEEEVDRKDYYRIERSFGSFHRTLSLPCEIQSEKSEAVYKKGILTITMPKSETAKTVEKKLTIKNA